MPDPVNDNGKSAKSGAYFSKFADCLFFNPLYNFRKVNLKQNGEIKEGKR